MAHGNQVSIDGRSWHWAAAPFIQSPTLHCRV